MVSCVQVIINSCAGQSSITDCHHSNTLLMIPAVHLGERILVLQKRVDTSLLGVGMPGLQTGKAECHNCSEQQVCTLHIVRRALGMLDSQKT